ncbi:MAG: response regulator [Lentisphaerae bacterium]|jgi:two-component system, chemotaxis family, response regulator Rcp1|nr:response regulator [Lentisphaerota bacterium]MBT4819354.1 response regulator [Lentisphaerota bacterium]MBT5606760.1 response regulator [Lentisphaerota bacterium]MBT7061556.1 response regulator [Lentisphaerota bacterium]MBT7843893.1 response regulator [Lentisphaerota bacterium]
MLPRGTNAVRRVLLVEDGPDDVDLTLEALKEAGLELSLAVAENGVEAVAYLRGQGQHADAPRPDLVLLDLNLPRMDGREVLQEVKQDPLLRRIPIIVLTTSDAREDITQAYDLHANCCITKPIDFDRWIQLFQLIEAFWFDMVQLA